MANTEQDIGGTSINLFLLHFSQIDVTSLTLITPIPLTSMDIRTLDLLPYTLIERDYFHHPGLRRVSHKSDSLKEKLGKKIEERQRRGKDQVVQKERKKT